MKPRAEAMRPVFIDCSLDSGELFLRGHLVLAAFDTLCVLLVVQQ